ncbi:hypothetical protein [Hoylesella pleuritidis]|uniref:hypothetical protein n=1 Tax=Hoylesella pleuritidis TaxID=407975 RepID=UPI0028E9F201|nr:MULTISPECIES: hypothetical protein [Hoylesella]
MSYLIIALIALGVLTAAFSMLVRRKGDDERIVLPSLADCATCSGSDERCEQECMMEAATKPIEYYDDEELDVFRGRPADRYTDNEAALFAEVLYTMRPDEVRGWTRSLTLRGIDLPNQLKDEVFLMTEG